MSTTKIFVAFLIVAVLAPIALAQSGRKLMTREEAARRWGPAQGDPNATSQPAPVPASQPVPNAPAQSAPQQLTPVFVEVSGFQNSAMAEKLVNRLIEAGAFGDSRPVAERKYAELIMRIQPNVSSVPVQESFSLRGQNSRKVAYRVYVEITLRNQRGEITGKSLSDAEVFEFTTGSGQLRIPWGGSQSSTFSAQTGGPAIGALAQLGVRLPKTRNYYGQETLFASLRMILEAANDANLVEGR